MTETKRFELAWEDYDGWGIKDTLGEYSDDEDYIDWLSGQKAVDVLNHFAEENEQLKKALLFYIDVALCETSSNFNKDFDNICNNVFSCSYNEIKPLYSDISDEDDVFALFQR